MSDRGKPGTDAKREEQHRQDAERRRQQEQEQRREEREDKREEQAQMRRAQEENKPLQDFANPGAALGAGAAQTERHPGSASGATTGPNMDPAASPPSPNHPANPGAALQQTIATPQQTMTGLLQQADQGGGGEQSTVSVIEGFCAAMDKVLSASDVYGARDLVQQFRERAPDIARSLKPR